MIGSNLGQLMPASDFCDWLARAILVQTQVASAAVNIAGGIGDYPVAVIALRCHVLTFPCLSGCYPLALPLAFLDYVHGRAFLTNPEAEID